MVRFKVVDLWKFVIDSGFKLVCIFLDLIKVFDVIKYSILFVKFEFYGIKENIF